jgi:hypothetical protein
MLGDLSRTLGLPDEAALLSAIRAAAGSDLYRSGWSKEFIDRENFALGMMEHHETGWAAGVVCGPAELVAGRMIGPVVTRYTFPKNVPGLPEADAMGSVLLRSALGVEVELPCPRSALVELIP